MAVKSEIFQFDTAGMSEVSNQVKEIFINCMLRENIITESQYKEMRKYSVIASEESMLGNFWSRLWKKSENKTTKLVVVKVLSKIEDESI